LTDFLSSSLDDHDNDPEGEGSENEEEKGEEEKEKGVAPDEEKSVDEGAEKDAPKGAGNEENTIPEKTSVMKKAPSKAVQHEGLDFEALPDEAEEDDEDDEDLFGPDHDDDVEHEVELSHVKPEDLVKPPNDTVADKNVTVDSSTKQSLNSSDSSEGVHVKETNQKETAEKDDGVKESNSDSAIEVKKSENKEASSLDDKTEADRTKNKEIMSPVTKTETDKTENKEITSPGTKTEADEIENKEIMSTGTKTEADKTENKEIMSTGTKAEAEKTGNKEIMSPGTKTEVKETESKEIMSPGTKTEAERIKNKEIMSPGTKTEANKTEDVEVSSPGGRMETDKTEVKENRATIDHPASANTTKQSNGNSEPTNVISVEGSSTLTNSPHQVNQTIESTKGNSSDNRNSVPSQIPNPSIPQPVDVPPNRAAPLFDRVNTVENEASSKGNLKKESELSVKETAQKPKEVKPIVNQKEKMKEIHKVISDIVKENIPTIEKSEFVPMTAKEKQEFVPITAKEKQEFVPITAKEKQEFVPRQDASLSRNSHGSSGHYREEDPRAGWQHEPFDFGYNKVEFKKPEEGGAWSNDKDHDVMSSEYEEVMSRQFNT
jgi:hypothetical protein